MKDDIELFLLHARKRCSNNTAVQQNTEESSPVKFFAEGDYIYEVRYNGDTSFSGEEIVKYKQKPVWSRVFFGSLVIKKSSFPISHLRYFVNEAKMELFEKQQLFGNYRFVKGSLEYLDISSGNLEKFIGEERVFCNEEVLFELKYVGGFLH